MKTCESTTVPFVSHMIGFVITPRPTTDMPPRVFDALARGWDADQYLEFVAKEAAFLSDHVGFGKTGKNPRTYTTHHDPMVQCFPRLVCSRGNERAFETELRVTIKCVGDQVNATVGSEIGISQVIEPLRDETAIPVARLGEVIEGYRQVAGTTCAWMATLLKDVYTNVLGGSIKKKGSLQVLTLGTNDEGVKNYLEGLSDGDNLSDAHIRLSHCLKLAGITDLSGYSYQLLTFAENSPINEQVVLFLEKERAGNREVIGLGCDKSPDGLLAYRANIRYARGRERHWSV